jgi:pimeloyl-ACP methyl ester carboxylesterase
MKTITRGTFIALAMVVAATLFGACTLSIDPEGNQVAGRINTVNAQIPTQSGYAPVRGLELYYEIHGAAPLGLPPLVLLHGAYMTIDLAFAKLLPTLAKTHQVIAVELQGHGRTADIDRPIRYELMAGDIIALLEHLGVDDADFFGYSMGGNVALQVAIQRPELVRKLVVASANYKSEGYYPEVLAMIETITPEVFAGSPVDTEYQRLAPNPQDFPTLVAKLKALDGEVLDWPAEDMQSIKAPTLIIAGDADVVRPEHAVEMYRLLGGGVPGDLAGLPNARLAVLPGTTHTGVMEQTDLLLALILPFLGAPMPEGE